MMVPQVSAQTDVLRVLVRAEVASESSFAVALEAHVSCQIVLQRVLPAAGGTLKVLFFRVAGAFGVLYPGDLRGRGAQFSVVDISRRMETLVKI